VLPHRAFGCLAIASLDRVDNDLMVMAHITRKGLVHIREMSRSVVPLASFPVDSASPQYRIR
jgi:hypothetical protein